MKTCSKCNETKRYSLFNKDRTKIDKHRYWCKLCEREDYTKYRDKLRTHINSIRSLGCERCDETDPCCIDFHHNDPLTKEIEIAFVIRNGWSIERINKEILKCTRLCANCHRKLHNGGTL